MGLFILYIGQKFMSSLKKRKIFPFKLYDVLRKFCFYFSFIFLFLFVKENYIMQRKKKLLLTFYPCLTHIFSVKLTHI